jgi:hypothetical protein
LAAMDRLPRRKFAIFTSFEDITTTMRRVA